MYTDRGKTFPVFETGTALSDKCRIFERKVKRVEKVMY